MLVYFSANARNIKKDIKIYRLIADAVRRNGGVLINDWIEVAAQRDFPTEIDWWRSMCREVQDAIYDANTVIVVASGASTLGVGYEMARALEQNKSVLALIHERDKYSYVRGILDKNLKVVTYSDSNVGDIVAHFLQDQTEGLSGEVITTKFRDGSASTL
jgi:hypothetical protein